MAFLSSMNVVGSGLTAQQLRLDVVSENITNRTTTRTEGAEPTDARWWYLRRRESAARFRRHWTVPWGEEPPAPREAFG